MGLSRSVCWCNVGAYCLNISDISLAVLTDADSFKDIGPLLGSPPVPLLICSVGVEAPCWVGVRTNHQYEGAHSSYLPACSVLHGCSTASPWERWAHRDVQFPWRRLAHHRSCHGR